MVVVLAAGMIFAGAACSSSLEPDSSDTEAGGGVIGPGEEGVSIPPADEGSPLPDTTITPPPFASGKGDSAGAAVAGLGSDVPTLDPQGEGGKRFARLSASYNEDQPDAERTGVTERYSEALAIDVEGLGDSFLVRVKFAGDLPDEMSTPNTYMVIGFGMSGETEGDNYAFGAQASDKGWTPYAGSKSKTADEFPGTFIIQGDVMEMTIPWDFVGGPRPFEWYSNASWFQHIAGVTSYSFDVIPNGTGRYPN